MPDSRDDLSNSLRRQSAEAHERLLESIRANTTEQQRRDEWDQMRGAGRHRPSTAGPRWRDSLSDLWTALCLRRLPQGLASVTAVFLISLFAYSWWARGTAVLRRQPEAGIAAELPSTLRLKLSTEHATLAGEGAMLVAQLGILRGGGGAIRVLDVDFDGKDRTGAVIHFTGTMIVTNAPGVSKATIASEVLGVLLDGDLSIGGNPPKHVQQSFTR